MVLKTKLSLGLGFLFLIIFALAFFCAYHVEKLASKADNILKDNYNSIVYSKTMFSLLDDMRTAISSSIFNPSGDKKITDYYLQLFESSKIEFEKNLNAERNNITEIHEKEYVDTLTSNYALYLNLCAQIKKGSGSPSMYFNDVLPCYEKLKQSINNINDLNMQAVERKNQMTKQQATNVITSISAIATLCVMLAFGYFWYFPLYISTILSDLASRMTKLLKKMGIACDIKTNDEAYIILQSIKLLEKKLGVEVADKDAL
ncbi:MAG TPA: hypothetical protein VIJ25_08920 [Methylococcales bacterium]